MQRMLSCRDSQADRCFGLPGLNYNTYDNRRWRDPLTWTQLEAVVERIAEKVNHQFNIDNQALTILPFSVSC